MSPDCRELVQKASVGDAVACEDLLVRHLDGLHAFVRLRAGRLLRAKESTADIVQSVCREVLQDLGAFEYRDEAHFRHWLYQSALRKVLDRAKYYRRARRDAAREASPPATDSEARLLDCYASFCTPSRAAIAHEELACIEACFARLSDEHREVITLARLVGLSRAEIGRLTGRSEGAVKVLLHRALARLSRLLVAARGQSG